MQRDILLVPDARLKTPCALVERFDEDLRRLVEDLTDTMRSGPRSVGVAASQIGEMWRVVVVDTSGHRKFGGDSQGFFALINPRVVAHEGQREGREGCMSLPDFTAIVRRFATVTVEFQDLHGQAHSLVCHDFEAVAVQHEIDHLDGILFLDRVTNLQTDVFARKKK